MLRGIAHNVAQGILTLLAIFCAVCAAIAWFFPKTRLFFGVLGGIVLVFYLAMGISSTLDSISRRNYERKYGDKPLTSPTVIDGLPLKERYARGESGKVSHAILARDFEVQGFPAKEGTEIRFHDSGDLMGWTASRPVVIWGRSFPAGTEFFGMMHGDEITAVVPGKESVNITRPKP